MESPCSAGMGSACSAYFCCRGDVCGVEMLGESCCDGGHVGEVLY